MAIDVKEFQQLKANVARLQREADKAEGAYAEQMNRLKTEFDCKTIEDACALLSDLETKLEKAKQKFRKMKDKFDKDWGKVLEDL